MTGGQKYGVRALIQKPPLRVRLLREVERTPVGRQDLAALACQAADDSRTGHPTMTGDVNAFAFKVE